MTIFKGTILLVIGVGLVGSSCGQDLKIFTGTIDSHFHLSSTYTLTEDKRNEFEMDIEFYAKRKQLLTDYFTKLSSGDNDGARRILKKDKELKDKDAFTLSYMFTLVRMKELKTLYKPSIQINDDTAEGILISCTPTQFEILNADKREYTLECRYIGELIVDNAKAYELVTIK